MKKIVYLCAAFMLVVIFGAGAKVLPAQAAMSDWQRGVSIQPNNTWEFGSDTMKRSLDALKATGANYVALIIPYYQAERWTSDMYPSWNTPTDESLAAATDYAHSIGLKVIYKPHLETNYIEWRGNINPQGEERVKWYNSYATMLERYGRIAQAHSVEDYVIGTELLLMANPDYDPNNTQRWKDIIARVRAVYKGQVSYSANWYGELDKIQFWPQLDYIGISAYYDLSQAQNNSTEQIKGAWDKWRREAIEPIQQRYSKPVVFTEIGYRSIDGAWWNPWDWSRDGNYNEYDQAQSYRALFEYWNNYPYMKGVSLWKWEINPPGQNSGDKNYSPQNKQAQSVMSSAWTGVGNPNPENPANGMWSTVVSATPSNPTNGQLVSVNANIRMQGVGSISGTNVDIEIFSESGSQVYQKIFTDQNFTSGVSRVFDVTWNPSANGKYVVKVGVFNGNWTQVYYWNNEAAVINASGTTNNPPPPPPTSTTTPPTGGTTTPPTNPPPADISLDIWWPTNGAVVGGVQPFKAMLTNTNIDTYNMYWQVDGDRLNDMYTSPVDYPHKEATVDLSGWNWRDTGIYSINFIAKTLGGSTLKERTVNINVAR